MSARAWALLHNEARLQYRYGLYAAYAIVVTIYVALLLGLAPLLPAWGTAAIIFTDPSALGFFFLGALMMLERNEGVRRALAAAPVKATGEVRFRSPPSIGSGGSTGVPRPR